VGLDRKLTLIAIVSLLETTGPLMVPSNPKSTFLQLVLQGQERYSDDEGRKLLM
jgi:hypothetical protein